MTDGSLSPITLRGRTVQLEPMAHHHADELCSAAAEDRSTFAYTRVPHGPEETAQYIAQALTARSEGNALPFVVRYLGTGGIVGTTRYLDLATLAPHHRSPSGALTDRRPTDEAPPTVAEIGNTWYAISAQRTAVNTESKYLLLEHAFEAWHALRITLKTDARNQRSRDAISRIGATFEGIRRRHIPAADGTVRDTAYYSIISDEWPRVRAALLARLERRA